MSDPVTEIVSSSPIRDKYGLLDSVFVILAFLRKKSIFVQHFRGCKHSPPLKTFCVDIVPDRDGYAINKFSIVHKP